MVHFRILGHFVSSIQLPSSGSNVSDVETYALEKCGFHLFAATPDMLYLKLFLRAPNREKWLFKIAVAPAFSAVWGHASGWTWTPKQQPQPQPPGKEKILLPKGWRRGPGQGERARPWLLL